MKLITNNIIVQEVKKTSNNVTKRLNEPTPSFWNKVGFISGLVAGACGLLIKPAMAINPIAGIVVSSIAALAGVAASIATTMTSKDKTNIFKKKKVDDVEKDEKTIV